MRHFKQIGASGASVLEGGPLPAREAHMLGAMRLRGPRAPSRGLEAAGSLEDVAAAWVAAARRWNAQPPASRFRGSEPERVSALDPLARFLIATGVVPIPSSSVRADLVELARLEAARAATELGTTVPEVRWFRRTNSTLEAKGWFTGATPDAIWLSRDDLLRPSQVSGAVAHEAKHRQDHLAGRPLSEAAADAFAVGFALSGPPRGCVGMTYRPLRVHHRTARPGY